jgi:hypothetical protein
MDTTNLIINGNFNLWQRGITTTIPYNATYSNIGTSGSTLTAQTEIVADRWYAIDAQKRAVGSTGSISLYREELTSPVSTIRGNANYYLTVLNQITQITGGYLYLENKQEDATSFMNMPLTLTFSAKSVGGVTGISMSCYYRQVANANLAETSYENPLKIEVLPYWKTFSVNFNISPFSVSSLGSNHYFAIGFKIPPQSSISIAGVKLQPTKSETDSTLLTDSYEEKKLQSKYYFTTYAVGYTAGSHTTYNGNDLTAFKFTVNPNYSENFIFESEMRKTPTITFYSPSGAINDGYNKTAAKDMRLTSGTRGWNQATRFSPTGAATLSSTPNKYGIQIDVFSGAVIFDDILVHMVADADIYTAPYDRGLESVFL